MKLNEGFIVHEIKGETMLVPTGNMSFSGIVKGNRTFGVLLELLKYDITWEELITAMRDRFEAPEGVIESDMARHLDELRKIGAIEE